MDLDVSEESTQQKINVRYVANFGELEIISHIDSLSFLNHCNRKKLENILRYKKAFAAVAIEEDKIIGFVVYYAEKNNYIISRMAVHPEYRRKGCGKILIEKICSKLSLLKKHVEIVVKESNVNAQLFFKSMGFTVVETIRNKFTTYHDDLPSVPYIEDGLLFRFGK